MSRSTLSRWLRRGATTALVAGVFFAGCSLVNKPDAPDDPDDDGPGPGSGGQGNAGGSGTGAQGGGGSPPTCDLPSCPGTDTDCNQRGCTPEGACTMIDIPAGALCADNGGTVCDGMGACVECIDNTLCPGSCSGGMGTAPGTCDTTTHTCTPGVTAACDPYVCGATACLTSCATSADCIANFTCTASQCVPACSPILSIAAPINHVTYGVTQGQWMGDPLETLGAGKLWSMNSYTGNTVQRYASLSALIAQAAEQTLSLPQGWNGTGAVVYQGFLYYNKAGSPNVIKYNLSTQTQVLDVVIPNAGFMNTYHYQWGGYSDIDFAVDENGLWVIYATAGNGGNIVISRLDPSSLAIMQTWNTTRNKMSAGNAWMSCGYLYVTTSYSAASTFVDFRYNTMGSTGMAVSIAFQNPGGYNSQISYNPLDRKLYSWDNMRHQTYQVFF